MSDGLSWNGVPLDNTLGWVLAAGSKTLSMINRKLTTIVVPGRSGAVVKRGSHETATVPLVVHTPYSGLEALLALLDTPGSSLSRTGDASVSTPVVAQVTGYDGFNADSLTTVSVSVLLTDPFWRDTQETTVDEVLAASTTIECFSGSSAPIGDGLVKIVGPVDAVQFSNPVTGGTVAYSKAVGSSQALVYDLATQSARKVSSTSWSGGTDATRDLGLQGPKFTITPSWPVSPDSRVGSVKVDSTSPATGATVFVRGRGAYLVH